MLTYEIPYEALRRHIRFGFSNVPVDSDGIVRHSLYRISRGNGESAYSFAAEIYQKYTGELPACIQEGEILGYIPFSARPFEYYGSETAGLSFSKVVSGEIPAELFAGSIVGGTLYHRDDGCLLYRCQSRYPHVRSRSSCQYPAVFS